MKTHGKQGDYNGRDKRDQVSEQVGIPNATSGVQALRATDFTENLHTLRGASNANDDDKSTAPGSAAIRGTRDRIAGLARTNVTRAAIKKF